MSGEMADSMHQDLLLWLQTQRAQRRVKQEIVQLDEELVSCGTKYSN